MTIPDWFLTVLEEAGLLNPKDVGIAVGLSLCKVLRDMADQTRKTGREHGALLCLDKVTAELKTSRVVRGTATQVDLEGLGCPYGSTPIGSIHTHFDNPDPSFADLSNPEWLIGCTIASEGSKRHTGICWSNIPEEAAKTAEELANLRERFERVTQEISALAQCAQEDSECQERYRKAASEADAILFKARVMYWDYMFKYTSSLDCRKGEGD